MWTKKGARAGDESDKVGNKLGAMKTKAIKKKSGNTRKDLVLLLLASTAFVVVLVAGLAKTWDFSIGNIQISHALLLLVVLVFAVTAIILVWRTTTDARNDIERTKLENAELKQLLVTAEAVITAEPQILLMWHLGGSLRVISHTLQSVSGVPQDDSIVVQFAQWLDAPSERSLGDAMDALFRDGRSFNIILRTQAGGNLEAEGRAASGRAVVRFRDVAGYKRDLSKISHTHKFLARDIGSSRALLNALPMPAWLTNDAGRLTWINRAYVAAVEAESVEEVLERQIQVLEKRHRQAVEKVLKAGYSFRRRLGLITQGERRAHDVVVLKLKEGMAGTAIDVAAIETAKGELDRQVAAFDRTLDKVPTAVAIFDSERKLVFFNKAYCTLWSLDERWLKTAPKDGDVLDRLRELGRLPEVVNYRDWRGRVLESNQTNKEREDWWHLPDGRVVHVLSDEHDDGGVTHLYIDETERLGLESRVNSMIRVQGETLDSLTEGVAVFAPDGRLTLFNTALATIWKFSPELLRKEPHIDEIIKIASDFYDDPGTWQSLKQAVTAFSDQRMPMEGQMVRANQSVIDYATIPLPDGATLLTFVDVTASKRYERALVERNEALEAANRLKSQFIGHVSYQLRMPLTNIIGFTELLVNQQIGTLTDKQREYLEDISFSSKALLSIIDGILDLATLDAGALELNMKPIDVGDVINTVIEGVKDRAVRAGLSIDVEIAEDARTFVGDEARVRQIMYNLVSNAVGFSKSGGKVEIGCWCEAGDILIQVRDYGIGISPEQQSKVFERFESDSQGSDHRGAGLGLSIVKSLVAAHGGHTDLHSEPDAGTSVTIRLPRLGRHVSREPLDQTSGDVGDDQISA